LRRRPRFASISSGKRGRLTAGCVLVFGGAKPLNCLLDACYVIAVNHIQQASWYFSAKLIISDMPVELMRLTFGNA
jgi:hypothetical protein